MSTDHISALLIGASRAELTTLSSDLSQFSNYSIDSFYCTKQQLILTRQQLTSFDILICLINESNKTWLKDLSRYNPDTRPSIIVIADKMDNTIMRLAMQAGARDCFTRDIVTTELHSILNKIVADNKKTRLAGHNLTSIINAKGGSGASLIACNLAHICAAASNEQSLLLDMDLQFGTQSLQLDIKPAHTIVEALQDIDQMDADALYGYIAKHDSGLHLLTTLHEQIILPGEISVESMRKLLDLSYINHNRIFIDLPRQIDPLNAMVMEASNQVVIVVQQSLAHMRDAKRLVKIMRSELNIHDRNIFIVVNRYDPENSFSLKDIKNTLECQNILKIPNDYERVAAAANMGVPLLEFAKNTDITQSLIVVAEALGITIKGKFKHRSLIDKILSFFIRK